MIFEENSKEMKESSEWLFKAMRIFAWIVFIWFLVKAGAMIMSFGASVNNPEGAKDMYRGLDLSRYYEASFAHYTIIVFYYIIRYLLLAYMALFATRLLSVATLKNLFSASVAEILQKMSNTALGIFIISIIYNIHVEMLARYATIEADSLSITSIFLAGMVCVLSILFKKSVDSRMETN
jgi:hypothetical protein